MTTSGDAESIAQEFGQLWAESMSSVIAQVASASFPVEVASRAATEIPAPAHDRKGPHPALRSWVARAK